MGIAGTCGGTAMALCALLDPLGKEACGEIGFVKWVQGALAACRSVPAVQREVQQRVHPTVMDARLQGARAAETAAETAQQVLQRGLQGAAGGLGRAAGQLEGAANQAANQLKGAASQVSAAASIVEQQQPGQFRDLRPAAVAAAHPRAPPHFSASAAGQPPDFSAPPAELQAGGGGSAAALGHAPAVVLPPAGASGSGLAFHPSGQHAAGGALSQAAEAPLRSSPAAIMQPETGAGSPPASNQPSCAASPPAARDAGVARPNPAGAPTLGPATAAPPSAVRDADAAGIAKPSPADAASGASAAAVLQSPADSPVETLAAAQISQPGDGAAAAEALASQTAEPLPAARKQVSVRKKLRQRRVPSSQLGRCPLPRHIPAVPSNAMEQTRTMCYGCGERGAWHAGVRSRQWQGRLRASLLPASCGGLPLLRPRDFPPLLQGRRIRGPGRQPGLRHPEGLGGQRVQVTAPHSACASTLTCTLRGQLPFVRAADRWVRQTSAMLTQGLMDLQNVVVLSLKDIYT